MGHRASTGGCNTRHDQHRRPAHSNLARRKPRAARCARRTCRPHPWRSTAPSRSARATGGPRTSVGSVLGSCASAMLASSSTTRRFGCQNRRGQPSRAWTPRHCPPPSPNRSRQSGMPGHAKSESSVTSRRNRRSQLTGIGMQPRAGYLTTERKSGTETGLGLFPDSDVRDAGLTFSFLFDSRDQESFATQGLAAQLEYSDGDEPQCSKSRPFRVASSAPRERARAAIMASNWLIGRPTARLGAPILAEATAASRSKGSRRSAKSSSNTARAASARPRFRLPAGKSWIPSMISACVTVVVNSEPEGCRPSQATTARSGAGRNSSDRTLVSRTIPRRAWARHEWARTEQSRGLPLQAPRSGSGCSRPATWTDPLYRRARCEVPVRLDRESAAQAQPAGSASTTSCRPSQPFAACSTSRYSATRPALGQ